MQKETQPVDITNYKPSPADDSISNPMLIEARDIIERFGGWGSEKAKTFVSLERKSLRDQYAFAIPTTETLSIIARYSPLIEIGSGSGYWAMCLASLGADILAYDMYPPCISDPNNISDRNWHFRKSYYTVQKGDELSAESHSDRTLFLCWPPPENPMACRALEAYIKSGGHTVIVIGHMKPLSMGDVKFYELLKSLKQIEKKFIHGWPGIAEEILICSCKP